MIEIPITTDPAQKFNIVIDNVNYDVLVTYNSRFPTWMITIGQNGVDIVSGVPLIIGSNIINQYPNLGINNIYVVNLEDSVTDANVNNIGETVKAVVLTDDEVASVNTV